MLKLEVKLDGTRGNLLAARFTLHFYGQNTRDGLIMNVLMFPLAPVPNAQIAPSYGR